MRPMFAMFALAASLLALGCASTPRDGRHATVVGEWILTAIGGEAFDLPAGARTPTLGIAPDALASGLAGINRYSGSLDRLPPASARGPFHAGPFAVTRMAGPPEAMDFETRFLTLLADADAFEIDSGSLVLTGPGGEHLRFAPADE